MSIPSEPSSLAAIKAPISQEAHDMAVQRLIQAGATPLTWMGVMTEWQRD